MMELPGMQTGFFLEPIATCPVHPSLLVNFIGLYFYTGHLSLGSWVVEFEGT